MFYKYEVNIQENTRKCDFSKVANQLYWNHTSAWVFSYKLAAYLQNSCFDEHLSGTISANFYSTCLLYFSIQVCVKLGCFLIYFWLVQCSIQKEQSFVLQNFLCSISDSFHVKYCWIVLLRGGVWSNRRVLLSRGFPTIPNLLNYFKISQKLQKSYFIYNINYKYKNNFTWL